jgi:hypothetical protein
LEVVSFTPLPLYPRGKKPPFPVGEEVEWTTEPVWTTRRSENSCTQEYNGRKHFKHLSVDERTILKRILKEIWF